MMDCLMMDCVMMDCVVMDCVVMDCVVMDCVVMDCVMNGGVAAPLANKVAAWPSRVKTASGRGRRSAGKQSIALA